MSIIDSFDSNSEEIISPHMMIRKIEGFPEIAILVFENYFLDILKEKQDLQQITYMNEGEKNPVYKIKYNSKEFAILRTNIGGAGTAVIAEELIAKGVKKILIFGTCGILVPEKVNDKYIIPTEAYRDEGVSYHYVKASDYINIPTSKRLSDIFDELNEKYVLGKIWTTDAIYRETLNNAKKRIEEGCIAADMECSAIMAVGNFRKVPVYQFLFSDGNVGGKNWDEIYPTEESKRNKYIEILELGLKVADKI